MLPAAVDSGLADGLSPGRPGHRDTAFKAKAVGLRIAITGL